MSSNLTASAIPSKVDLGQIGDTKLQAVTKGAHKELCMTPPGSFSASLVLPSENRARETAHLRGHEADLFRIHHLFMANTVF